MEQGICLVNLFNRSIYLIIDHLIKVVFPITLDAPPLVEAGLAHLSCANFYVPFTMNYGSI